MTRARLRELGVNIGQLEPGPHNAITDVEGVKVGHVTIMREQPKVIRTGVTVIVPHSGNLTDQNCFGAAHVLNGNGEVLRVDADHRHLQPYQIVKRYTFSSTPYSATNGPRAADTTPDGAEVYVTVVEDGSHPTPALYRIDTWLDRITGGPLAMASLPANVRIQQR